MRHVKDSIQQLKRFRREVRDYVSHKRLLSASNRIKPAFMIIGAAKCGTTSLFQYLAAHPDVEAPVTKEFKYFGMQNQRKGLNWYLESYPRNGKAAATTFEATPTYLAIPNAPRQIRRLFPKLKFIVLLRDPIARAYSHWHWHRFSEYAKTIGCVESRSFEQAVNDELNGIPSKSRYFDYVSRGHYAKQLIHWFKYFPRNQFLIIDSLELRNERIRTLNDVAAFLDFSKDFSTFEQSNDSVGEAWKPVQQKTQQLSQFNVGKYDSEIDADLKLLLENHYSVHNADLEKILNRKFSWS